MKFVCALVLATVFCEALTTCNALLILQEKHGKIKSFTCEVCSKKFSRKFNLEVHMKTHVDQCKHVCPLCGETFTQKSNLKRHHFRKHVRFASYELEFACSVTRHLRRIRTRRAGRSLSKTRSRGVFERCEGAPGNQWKGQCMV